MKSILRLGKPFPVTSKKLDDCNFASDGQEVESIKDYFGNKPTLNQFDSFFVLVGDGDYDAVYGMSGIIPYNHKTVRRITLQLK